MAFFGFGKKEKDKMKTGLEKTRTGFWGSIMNTLTGSVIDDEMYDDLEEQLILADVGGEVAVHLVDKLRDRVRDKGLKTGEQAADALRDIIAEEMTPEAEMALDGKPAVILVIGVNGVGKTTLFKLITGLLRPRSGRCVINGMLVPSMRDVFLMTEHANLISAMSVRDNIRFRGLLFDPDGTGGMDPSRLGGEPLVRAFELGPFLVRKLLEKQQAGFYRSTRGHEYILRDRCD